MTVVFVVSNAGVRLGCWLHLVLFQAKTTPLGTIAKCDVNVHSCKRLLNLPERQIVVPRWECGDAAGPK